MLYGVLSEQVKGIGLIIVGIVLLLYLSGILLQLDFFILVFFGLYLIALGIFKLDRSKRIQRFLEENLTKKKD